MCGRKERCHEEVRNSQNEKRVREERRCISLEHNSRFSGLHSGLTANGSITQ